MRANSKPIAYRHLASLALCFFASNLWAGEARITLENLPGLASDGSNPVAAMVSAKDGALYGSTKEGGTHHHGTLYRVAPGVTPHVSTVYSFDEDTYSPEAPMVAAGDGNLYGITSVWKKLYRLRPGSTPEVKLFPFAFKGSDDANDHLVSARDGALYGTIRGDQHGAGGIYRIAPGANPKVTRVWTFTTGECSLEQTHVGRQDRATPGMITRIISSVIDATVSHAVASRPRIPSCQVNHLKLVAASDGNLYGATQGAGKDGRTGFLYRVIPGEQPSVEIVAAPARKGGAAWHPNSLVATIHGELYGTMMADDRKDLGAVFVIKPGAKTVATTLLPNISAEFRGASLAVAGRDGRLYGITSGGGSARCGSLFMVTPAGVPKMTTLLSFTSEQMDGDCTFAGAAATLIAGSDGELYGTLTANRFVADASKGPGGIFRVITSATPSAARILSFSRQLGSDPGAPLVVASDGHLYGTTRKGAAHGFGSVFRLAPRTSTMSRLFSFDARDRVQPHSALTAGADGKLYGTAPNCCGDNGIAYQVNTDRNPGVNAFHSFRSNSSAGGPGGQLAAGVDGALYGVTRQGGNSGHGSVYRVTTGDAATVTQIFEFNSASGANPISPLIAARNGVLYGMTEEGGASDMGSIFRITPGATNPVSLWYSYGAETGRPYHYNLTFGGDGRMYGAIGISGSGCGNIYRLHPALPGKVEFVHRFDASSCRLQSGLVAAADGSIYFATNGNSSNDDGSIFRLTTGSNASAVRVGSFSDDNRFSGVTLHAGVDGNIYGLAFRAGDGAGGELFRVTSGPTPTISTMLTFERSLRPDSTVTGRDGYFYATSLKGGAHGKGAILRYKPGSRSLELLYSFSDKGDGAYPSTPLMSHSDGCFYGMTLRSSMRSNGRASLGRVFRFQPPP